MLYFVNKLKISYENKVFLSEPKVVPCLRRLSKEYPKGKQIRSCVLTTDSRLKIWTKKKEGNRKDDGARP